MGIIPALTTFVDATTAVAADVNSNFTNVRDTFNTFAVLTDAARTITATHSYSITQTFTGGWTAGAACSISTGGFTVTAGGLTVTAGTTAVQALTATTLVLASSATVGTLASGNITLSSGYLAYGDAVARLLGGATSFAIRNNANTADNVLVSNAGAVTIRSGLTITSSGLTVSNGLTTLSGGALFNGGSAAAAAGVINADGTHGTVITGYAGATNSLSLRDAGGTARILVTAAGVVTLPTGITVTGAKTTTAATVAGYASLNLPHGTAPTSPVNGDMWTTTAGAYVQVNGTTVGPLLDSTNIVTGSGTATRVPLWSSTSVVGNSNIVQSVSGHIHPVTHDTYDLGITGTRWKNIYARGADFSGAVSASSFTSAIIDNSGGAYTYSGTQVVAGRRTGWTAATGTATRTTFATSTVTTAQLAERVKALLDDLIVHGLIGA